MGYKYYFTVLLLVSSIVQAQVRPLGKEPAKNAVVFQSPIDGEIYVPARTTLIVRPVSAIVRGHSPEDFSFSVKGESSGIHQGKVIISDDHETVIFLPDNPFDLNEIVHVNLDFYSEAHIPPLAYEFHITPMTDSEQCYKLNLLRQRERDEIRAFQSKTATQREFETLGNPTDTLPPLFPKIRIDALDLVHVADGDIFLAPSGSSCIAIVNNSGTAQFARQIGANGADDFKMESGGRLSYFKLETIVPLGNLFQGTVYLLDSKYQTIDSFRCGNGYFTDDHDFRLLPNGHALVIAYDARDTDMRIVTDTPTAAKKATVVGGIIQELDTLKHVVFQWRTWDHLNIIDMANFDLTDPNHALIDYAHLNSVELDTDSNIIASFRAMDDIVKIRRDSQGRVIWRWGGKNDAINNFNFNGSVPFSSQHDVRRIANGHITMFDNGNYHKTTWGDETVHDTSYSRAIEYELDEGSAQAKEVWEYSNIPYSFASGNVQRLPNGNTFIGLGAQNIPNAVEVTNDGKKVFQLSLPNNPYNYRTFRFEFPPKSSVKPLTGSPEVLGFSGMYPNPASKAVTISFTASDDGVLQLEILDVLGHHLRSLNEKITEAGAHSQIVDLDGIPNGTYFCKLSGNGTFTMKMLVVQK